MSGRVVSINDRKLKLTNLEKVLYPQQGFTKAQVISYYLRIAPAMLPHLKDRPVTLKRYPHGVEDKHFYEKRCPSHRPNWVSTGEVPTNDEPLRYCLVNDAATLAWVANLASIELHTLLHLCQTPDTPTTMVFDLDPGEGVSVIDCARVALELREMLNAAGLQSFAKTSGGKGLHLHVPLNTPVTFAQTKSFARAVAQAYEKKRPDKALSQMAKSLRAGKTFIDWSQNDSHKTTVCVYSLRAKALPAVSTPLRWDELEAAIESPDANSLVFDARAAIDRFNEMGDLFAPVLSMKQALT
jgi:bifunctional non-homologous end joining protein LigD